MDQQGHTVMPCLQPHQMNLKSTSGHDKLLDWLVPGPFFGGLDQSIRVISLMVLSDMYVLGVDSPSHGPHHKYGITPLI